MKKITSIISSVALVASLALGFASCKKEAPVTVIGYRTGSLCAIPIHIAVLNGLFEKEFEAIGQKLFISPDSAEQRLSLSGQEKSTADLSLLHPIFRQWKTDFQSYLRQESTQDAQDILSAQIQKSTALRTCAERKSVSLILRIHL